MKTCPICAGTGQKESVKRTILGAIKSVSACAECDSLGQVPEVKCPKCKGAGTVKAKESMSIEIPPATKNGAVVKIPGKGEAVKGGEPGDLYIVLHVKEEKKFQVKDNDIFTEINIPLSFALLGGKKEIKSLDGKILEITVPSLINHKDILRVRGKGVPVSSTHKGDLLVQVNIVLPKKLSKKAKGLIKELEKEGL